MCLDPKRIQKFGEPKNWVEGYKIIRWAPRGKVWRSMYANQKWEFAELVKAKAPGTTHFSGAYTTDYKKGIHAWASFKEAMEHFETPEYRIVKVLLFGVTHHDGQSYRADAAIIIEALNRKGHRINKY